MSIQTKSDFAGAGGTGVTLGFGNRTKEADGTAPPSDQSLKHNVADTQTFIDDQDLDGEDRSTEWLEVTVGSILTISVVSDPENNYERFKITAIVDSTGYFTITRTLLKRVGTITGEVSVSLDIAGDSQLTSDELASIQGANNLSESNTVASQEDIAFNSLSTFIPSGDTFNSTGEYSDYTFMQDETISFLTVIPGKFRIIEWITDGTHKITFGSGIAEVIGPELILNAFTPESGTYSVYMLGTSKGVKINIPAFSSGGSPGVTPTFTGITKINDTMYDITSNVGLYGANDGNTPANSFDFSATLTQGTNGTATDATISSVTQSPSGALAGGETTIRITVSYTGTPNGYEQIKFGVAGSATLFNSSGTAMDSSDETSNVYVNCQTYTAFNGVDNYAWFGDIINSIIEVDNAKFAIECQVNNWASATQRIAAKTGGGSPADGIHFYFTTGAGLHFSSGNGTWQRVVNYTTPQSINDGDILRVEYDGSIDTNNGMDRVTIKINGTESGGTKKLLTFLGTLAGTITNVSNDSLAIGDIVNGAGANNGAAMFQSEMKDFKVYDGNGDIVIHIPTISVGIDISGNGNDLIWETA